MLRGKGECWFKTSGPTSSAGLGMLLKVSWSLQKKKKWPANQRCPPAYQWKLCGWSHGYFPISWQWPQMAHLSCLLGRSHSVAPPWLKPERMGFGVEGEFEATLEQTMTWRVGPNGGSNGSMRILHTLEGLPLEVEYACQEIVLGPKKQEDTSPACPFLHRIHILPPSLPQWSCSIDHFKLV